MKESHPSVSVQTGTLTNHHGSARNVQLNCHQLVQIGLYVRNMRAKDTINPQKYQGIMAWEDLQDETKRLIDSGRALDWRYDLTVGDERLYVCVKPPSTTHGRETIPIVQRMLEGMMWNVVDEGRVIEVPMPNMLEKMFNAEKQIEIRELLH